MNFDVFFLSFFLSDKTVCDEKYTLLKIGYIEKKKKKKKKKKFWCLCVRW